MATKEEKTKVNDGNYKAYTELINRLEDVKDAIKKQNYGIAMDILYKPYPEFQITTSTEPKESEDEKIRKAIYNCVKWFGFDSCFFKDVSQEECLAWLEKQGKNNMGISEATKQKLEDSLNEALEKETPESFNAFLDEQKPAETEKGANGNEREIPNSAWSEEDIVAIDCAVEVLSKELPSLAASIERLKSLRPQNTWKPSDEHYELEEFAKIVRSNLTGISKAVQELFEAKYIQLTGNKMYGGFKD